MNKLGTIFLANLQLRPTCLITQTSSESQSMNTVYFLLSNNVSLAAFKLNLWIPTGDCQFNSHSGKEAVPALLRVAA